MVFLFVKRQEGMEDHFSKFLQRQQGLEDSQQRVLEYQTTRNVDLDRRFIELSCPFPRSKSVVGDLNPGECFNLMASDRRNRHGSIMK